MKFNLKATVAAATLALSGASSFAAITTTTAPTLFLLAYGPITPVFNDPLDPTLQTGQTAVTYARDLGALSALGPNGVGNATFTNTGTSFSTLFGSTGSAGSFNWGVFALTSTAGSQAMYSTGAVSSLGGLVANSVPGRTAVVTASGPNGGVTALNLLPGAGGEYTYSNADLTDPGNTGNAVNLIDQLSFGNAVTGFGVGSSLNFVKMQGTTTSQYAVDPTLSAFNGNAAGGYFTLLNANGDVTWTGLGTTPPSAVPLPAGALLFGPGLLAVFAAARRRNTAA
jgi:hypothetical protein